MISVPEEFAAATISREGEAGRLWIGALPGLIGDQCDEWQLAVEGSVLHGYLGLVVLVRRGGEPCALKVSWVDEVTSEEAAALRVWGGRGAVRLLDAKQERGAMLLERLDHRRSLNDVPIAQAVRIAGALLRRLAAPAPDGFRSLQTMADRIASELPERWERCGRPMPRTVLDRARGLALDLGGDAGTLLVNYDVHYADMLAGRREPWLVVDPKVVAGSIEFGLAQLLWRRLEDIQANGGLEPHFRALIEAAERPRAKGLPVVPECRD